jgi:major membrane immunogen (membrane-anchored lipoprotein)
LSIDSHNRQRGSDKPDALLLVEGDESTEDVDVVIGAVESNKADHKAADELKAALGVKSKELAAALIGF